MTTKTLNGGLFKPEIWAKELLRKITIAGVMNECVNRDYEGEIKNQGDTVHVQKIGNVTVSTYTEGSSISYQDLNGETDTLVIDQKKYFGFKVPDIAKVQANVKFMGKYIDQAKKEMVKVQDTFLLGKSADVPSANQLGAVTVTSANIYNTLVDLNTLLFDAGAIDSSGKGADGKRPYIVINPKILAIVKKSPEFTHGTNSGDEVIRKGAVGEIAGFDIKVSRNLVAVESAYTILAGTTEAISFAEQIAKVETLRDKDSFNDLVRGLYLYGAKTLQPDCLASAVLTIG